MNGNSENGRLRVGLCGLGEIGQFHLKAINQSPEADLAAVCELDRSLAERSVSEGVAIHDDLSQMLTDENLDVVDICLPHHLHEPVATAALKAGCHVILEKPLAADLPGCDAISWAATEADRLVGVSHNQIFFEPHRRLIELVDQGRLGDLRSMYLCLWMGGKYGGWREDSTQVGGGLLMDAGVHRVYMALRLGGPVLAVSATMDKPRAEESFALTLSFEGGGSGVIQGSYHGPDGVFDDHIAVQGNQGMAQVAGCEAFFEGDLETAVMLRTRLDGEWTDDPASGAWDESVEASVRSILSSLAAGEQPEAGLEQGRAALELIEACYRSAEQGRTVELSEVRPGASA